MRKSVTSRSAPKWQLSLADFAVGYSGTFPGTETALRLLLVREYGRESKYICELVKALREQRGTANARQRSDLAARLEDYVYPYSPKIFLDESFPASAPTAHIYEAFCKSWQMRRKHKRLAQAKVVRGQSVIHSLPCTTLDSKGLPLPRYGMAMVSRVEQRDFYGRASIVCSESPLILGTDLAGTKAIKEALPRVPRLITPESRELVVPCIAVVVPVKTLPETGVSDLKKGIVEAASEAAKNGVAQHAHMKAIQVESRYGRVMPIPLKINDSYKTLAGLGESFVVVFPLGALDPLQFEQTRQQFFQSFETQPLVAEFAERANGNIQTWGLKRLNAALNHLWSLRIFHGIGEARVKRYAEEIRDKFPESKIASKNAHYFLPCANWASERDKASAAQADFQQIFTRADSFADRMWRSS